MRLFLTALLILPMIPALLRAHPHVFIDLSVAYDKTGHRLQVEWLIDEMASQLIALDYDANRNGRFEPAEEAAFLGEEGYAMLFRRGGFFLHPECPVEKLRAALEKNRVRVTFEAEVDDGTVGLWDEEYMFAFQLQRASDIAAVRESDDYYGYTLTLR